MRKHIALRWKQSPHGFSPEIKDAFDVALDPQSASDPISSRPSSLSIANIHVILRRKRSARRRTLRWPAKSPRWTGIFQLHPSSQSFHSLLFTHSFPCRLGIFPAVCS